MPDGDLPKLVSTEWLAERLGAPNVRVFDCTVELETTPKGVSTASGRPGWEAGHIPGAGFLDLLKDLSDHSNPLPAMMPPAKQFADVLGRAGVGADTRVVLYDRANMTWAARIWWLLRCYGFDRAAVLSGGFRAWRDEGRSVSTEPSAYPPARFEPRARTGLIANKSEVRAAVDDAGVLLMNALPPPIFSGAIAPYGRPGCIPGSCNVPAESLLDETGRLRPLEELREQFGAAGAFKAERVITYCGGGVSACADAFVLTMLGHDNVAVYDASLAEWSNDPTCPLDVCAR